MTARTEDEKHLRQLEIGHYIVAATYLLLCLLPIGMLVLLLVVPDPPDAQPPPPLAWVFIIAVIGFVLLYYSALAVLTILGGRWIAARRRKTGCIVVAALNCMHPPLGTGLGVFTILVIQRASVKRLFEGEPEPAAPAAVTPAPSSPSAASG